MVVEKNREWEEGEKWLRAKKRERERREKVVILRDVDKFLMRSVVEDEFVKMAFMLRERFDCEVNYIVHKE